MNERTTTSRGTTTTTTGFNLIDVVEKPYEFLGSSATKAQKKLSADNPNGAVKGPNAVVEDEGGPGTAMSHWKETSYFNELMTGWLDMGDNPLSILTVDSLQDLNYVVNAKNADDYRLPSLSTSDAAASSGGRLRRLRGGNPLESDAFGKEEEEPHRHKGWPHPITHKGRKYVDMRGDVYRGERGTVDLIPRRKQRPEHHYLNNSAEE